MPNRPLYAPRGKYVVRGYNQFSRRMGRSFRNFLLTSNVRAADTPAASTVDLYWVSDTNGAWHDEANWSLTTGGAGGAGVPGALNQVTFDGEGTGLCRLEKAGACKELIFNETAAQVNASFDQQGNALSCETFAYDCANNTSPIFDGQITLSGATLTVTNSVSAAPFASANFVLAANCTVASDNALPQITAQEDFTTSAALTVARLIGASGKTFTFKNGVDFTLTAYTSTDWDNLAEVVSVSGAQWGFVNPASMVWRNIADIQDCNATNAINAADRCSDGTGNTNVQVALYWIGADGGWHDADNWSLASGGAAEGNVYPISTNDVFFDGAGAGLCTPTASFACRDLLIDESDTQVHANLDQNGQVLACRTFVYNCANNNANVFDFTIAVSGAAFTVTAAQAASIFSAATITLAAACTVTSTDDTNLPAIQAADDVTFATAVTVASLLLTGAEGAGQALEFLNSVNFTLTAYTAGDWDGDATADTTIVSDDSQTWGFVNPAAMVVSYIDVQDSNATNAIDATDNCVDGTGNTNWTFV